MASVNPLARVSPAASTWTDLYTPPVANGSANPPFIGLGTVAVYICPSAAGVNVSLAVVGTAGTTPAVTDYLLNNEQVRQIGPIQVTNPATLRCWASATGVAFIVMGLEE